MHFFFMLYFSWIFLLLLLLLFSLLLLLLLLLLFLLLLLSSFKFDKIRPKKKKCLRQGSNPLDQKPKILAFLLPLIPMLFFLSLQFLAVRLWRHLWREIRTSYGSRSKQNFIPSMRVILPTVQRPSSPEGFWRASESLRKPQRASEGR